MPPSFVVSYNYRALTIDLCDYPGIINFEKCDSDISTYADLCLALSVDPVETCGGALCYIEKSNHLLNAI